MLKFDATKFSKENVFHHTGYTCTEALELTKRSSGFFHRLSLSRVALSLERPTLIERGYPVQLTPHPHANSKQNNTVSGKKASSTNMTRNHTVKDIENRKELRATLEECSTCVDVLVDPWQIDDNIDFDTSYPTSIEEEIARLETLKSYSILDSEREDSFERVTALAARVFNAPICLVSLVDLGRQWFLSNR